MATAILYCTGVPEPKTAAPDNGRVEEGPPPHARHAFRRSGIRVLQGFRV